MALTEIELALPPASAILEEKVHAVRRDVELLAADIRRLSHNLHPSTVIQLSPKVSLRQLCREFSEQTHISVEFVGGNVSSPMSEDVAVALFRIGQECLTNVVKHSKSPDARVSLSEESGEIRLTIADRGVGFDTGRPQANPGLGLVSVQERARMIGGLIEIRSSTTGTTVELRVPTPAIASAS
jgi:two-component system CheB/CheR fusion protein